MSSYRVELRNTVSKIDPITIIPGCFGSKEEAIAFAKSCETNGPGPKFQWKGRRFMLTGDCARVLRYEDHNAGACIEVARL